MKSIILFIAVLSLQSFSSFNEKHIGVWTGEHNGDVGTLILYKNNDAVLIIDDEVFGGDNFVSENGIKFECKYEIDYSKNPVWLDIVIYIQETKKEVGRMKGIIRFLSDTKMEYRIGFDGTRYKDFDPGDEEDTMILYKVGK